MTLINMTRAEVRPLDPPDPVTCWLVGGGLVFLALLLSLACFTGDCFTG